MAEVTKGMIFEKILAVRDEVGQIELVLREAVAEMRAMRPSTVAMSGEIAAIYDRLGRVEERLGRVEKRLGLVDIELN